MITTTQIKQHRKEQKESGVVGCKNGDDMPLQSLKGISWRPADPMNPSCFCHDCRTTWDPEGSIDLELINQGNEQACVTYASLIPDKKETLMVLRCATDDALEDFVKAQFQLENKTNEIKHVQELNNKKNESYTYMNNQGYAFLKTYEADIDNLYSEILRTDARIQNLKDQQNALEVQCTETGNALNEARKKEREFLEKNF